MTQPARPRQVFYLTCIALTVIAIGESVYQFFPIGVRGTWGDPIRTPAWELLWVPLPLFGAFLFLASAACRKIEQTSRAEETLVLTLCVLLAMGLQLCVMHLGIAGSLESVLGVVVPRANAYHQRALSVSNVSALLANYHTELVQRDFAVQLSTHPPGPILLFWAFDRLASAHAEGTLALMRWLSPGLSQTLGWEPYPLLWARLGLKGGNLAGAWLASMFLRFAACAAVVPAYLLARLLYSKRVALMGACLCAVLPGLYLFSPGIDQVFPVLALFMAYFALRAVCARSMVSAILAGLTLFIGMFFSLAFLVVLVFLIASSTLWMLQERRMGDSQKLAWTPYVRTAVGALVGFLVPILLLLVVFGYNSFAVWPECSRHNDYYHAQSGREYWDWILVNPIEFALCLGLPAMCLFLWRAGAEFLAVLRDRSIQRTDVVALAFAGIFLLLAASGKNLGEVARLWLFLMPFCLVFAVPMLHRVGDEQERAFSLLLCCQFAQVVLLKLCVDAQLCLYANGF